ncbi:MAG: hypothetical protein IJ679_05770 [Lachnospiraceae bacterium]|nr:hypothetical protein [Lachnospiraceae bacterium]
MKNDSSAFSGLALGEKLEMDAGVLCLTLDALGNRALKSNNIVDFQRINRILAGCIPKIVERGGIVINYGLSSALTLFPQNPGEALACVLSIFSLIEQMPEEKKAYFDKISLALCFGSVTVGMVGYGDYSTPLASSETVLLCGLLQKRAAAYYSRILATDAFLDQIPMAKEKFNYRILGVVYLSGTKKKEMVFDVFEGDEPEVRNIKRRTKNTFEKGVELYLVRHFSEARNYFLEVIRTDRRDLAAKEYLLRCDDYIHGVKDSGTADAAYFEVL